MKKGIQYFSKEYLKGCEKATPDQIIEFLENYRMLFSKDQARNHLVNLKEEKPKPNP